MSDPLMPPTVKLVAEWLKGEDAVTDIFGTRISYRLTGTYPAIRLTDLGPITRGPEEQLRRIQVECWAADYDTAERGAATVESVVVNARAAYDGIGYCAGGAVESGPFANPDPASQKFRHQLDVALWLYPTPQAGANGLFPLDGVHDPWRWAPEPGWWVGPAYEVTWSTGDEVPVPDLPVGGEHVRVYVTDETTYLGLLAAGTYVASDSAVPMVKESDGSGIAFLVQAQPGWSAVMDAPPNPELDVLTMLGDVTLVPGTVDPWQWSDAWGGWVGPAYELTWTTGDSIAPADLDLNYRVYVIEDDAPDAPDDYTYLTGWTTGASLPDVVATSGGSGVGYVIQHEPGYAHTAVPDADVDPSTMFGDFVVGDPYEFPDLAPGPVFYPWPE